MSLWGGGSGRVDATNCSFVCIMGTSCNGASLTYVDMLSSMKSEVVFKCKHRLVVEN